MAPKKEPCRNFQRGSCQYGERCKFLHATPLQPKPSNAFGFGMQSGTQFQRSNSQQQQPNPFGFGVQNNSQPRGASDFGSKQNQFKPFENKWTRSSPVNANSSHASRQPDTQPPASNHKCTDPESCKRQIIEDFEHERPLWKLTCYSHWKNAPCDIVGDISYEELRASAYDDAKRGLNLQSIAERERNLYNSKLLEFESLLRNPYVAPSNSAIATQNLFSGVNPNVSSIAALKSAPPSVSSFSQLSPSPAAGFGPRPATPPNTIFGQPISLQSIGQTSSTSGTNSGVFGSVVGGQPPIQSFSALFPSNGSSFSNNASSAQQRPFSTSTFSPQIPSKQSSMLPGGPNLASHAVGQSILNVHNMDKLPIENADSGVWLKEEWIPGEIPEAAPPDQFIY